MIRCFSNIILLLLSVQCQLKLDRMYVLMLKHLLIYLVNLSTVVLHLKPCCVHFATKLFPSEYCLIVYVSSCNEREKNALSPT